MCPSAQVSPILPSMLRCAVSSLGRSGPANRDVKNAALTPPILLTVFSLALSLFACLLPQLASLQNFFNSITDPTASCSAFLWSTTLLNQGNMQQTQDDVTARLYLCAASSRTMTLVYCHLLDSPGWLLLHPGVIVKKMIGSGGNRISSARREIDELAIKADTAICHLFIRL